MEKGVITIAQMITNIVNTHAHLACAYTQVMAAFNAESLSELSGLKERTSTKWTGEV